MTGQRPDYSSRSGRPQLAGKFALVTGASRGIGEATARRLAHAGAAVAVVARSADRLAPLVDDLAGDGHTAIALPADISRPDHIDTALNAVRDAFGRLDILINNAGTAPASQRAETMSLHDWQTTLDVNLTAPWYTASRARDLMVDGSVVVNVSSTAAFYPSIGFAPYNVSKAGLNMLTRVLALEWAAAGIRVVGVAPGKTDTELAKPAIAYTQGKGQRYNPLGRVADPDEIAELITFLVCDDARFMTGSTHVIDGGELLSSSR